MAHLCKILVSIVSQYCMSTLRTYVRWHFLNNRVLDTAKI